MAEALIARQKGPIYAHLGHRPTLSGDVFVAPNAAVIGRVSLAAQHYRVRAEEYLTDGIASRGFCC